MSEGLKSADPHERSRAVDALGDSQDHAGAVRALEAVLRQDPNRNVRIDATVVLGNSGDRTRPPCSSRWRPAPMNPSSGLPPWRAIETSRDPSAIPG